MRPKPAKKLGPMKACWLCGRRGRKYFAEHHVYTVGEEPDITVTLHRGCHWLVNVLSRFKLIGDAKKVADLITLARSQAGYPNTRVKVTFEEI